MNEKIPGNPFMAPWLCLAAIGIDDEMLAYAVAAVDLEDRRETGGGVGPDLKTDLAAA